MAKDKQYDPVSNPREAEQTQANVPNDDPNVARDEGQPNDSTTGSQPETPGAGTQQRTDASAEDAEAPKADGNATRHPGPKGEPNKPGEETAQIDKAQ